jgi:hypothetical protein
MFSMLARDVTGVLMGDLYREDPRGCLLWCAFMFGCPGLAMLSIIIEEQTGFHLRNVGWFQSTMETVIYGLLVIGGGYLLIKLLTSSDDDNGGGGSSTLDRGAGTMSWDDSGDGGGE